ncbi:hypothetical protein ISN40_01000 [Enterobacter asburiae]|nr:MULTISPECIES: hypothetical protein [Enterobacter]MBF2788811.1 hypothetical protein [Enterobacter asburiae]
MSITIRQARPEDAEAIYAMIYELAVKLKCGRLEWSVLDWNQPAIDFYLSIGALPQSEWVRSVLP